MELIILTGGSEFITVDEKNLAMAVKASGIECSIYDWKNYDPKASDVVIFRSCWDYHLQLDRFRKFLDKLQDNNIRSINALELVRWNIEKSYLIDLSNEGIRVPKTFHCTDIQSLQRAKDQFSDTEEIIIKPAISASAHGLSKIRTSDLVYLIEGEATIVQEYITDIEDKGEISLIFFGDKFSHAILKKPKSGDFRVQNKFGGQYYPFTPDQNCIRTAQDILAVIKKKFGLAPDYARVDIIETKQGFTLMELELIEPNLFLYSNSNAIKKFCNRLLNNLTHGVFHA